MPSANAVRAGRAYVELFAKTSELHKQFRSELAKVTQFANEAARVSRFTISLSVVASYPIKKLLDDFTEFDDKLKVVKATTHTVGEEFNGLTELARKLGRETSFTAHEVASGMVQLGRAGFEAVEIQESLGHFLNLSRATATELSKAVDIATATLRGFNMKATESERVVDVLTVTANSSAQTLEDIGDAFKYIIPLSNAASVSLEEAAKATGVMANLGIKGTMAATGMRNILLRMSLPNIQEIYRNELGVEVIDQETGALRTFSEVMNDVAKALKNVSGAKRLAIFREIFGLYGLAGGAALSSGVDFTKMFAKIDNATGEASRIAAEMDEGIGGMVRLAWSKIKDINLALGQTLQPTLYNLGASIEDLALKISNFVRGNSDLLNSLLDVAKGFASSIAYVIKYGSIIAKYSGILAITKAFIQLSPIIYAVSKSFSVIKNSVVGLVNGFNSLVIAIYKLGYIKNYINNIRGRIYSLREEVYKFLDTLSGRNHLARTDALLSKLETKLTRNKKALEGLSSAFAKAKETEEKALLAFKTFQMEGLPNVKAYREEVEKEYHASRGRVSSLGDWYREHKKAYDKAAENVRFYQNQIVKLQQQYDTLGQAIKRNFAERSAIKAGSVLSASPELNAIERQMSSIKASSADVATAIGTAQDRLKNLRAQLANNNKELKTAVENDKKMNKLREQLIANEKALAAERAKNASLKAVGGIPSQYSREAALLAENERIRERISRIPSTQKGIQDNLPLGYNIPPIWDNASKLQEENKHLRGQIGRTSQEIAKLTTRYNDLSYQMFECQDKAKALRESLIASGLTANADETKKLITQRKQLSAEIAKNTNKLNAWTTKLRDETATLSNASRIRKSFFSQMAEWRKRSIEAEALEQKAVARLDSLKTAFQKEQANRLLIQSEITHTEAIIRNTIATKANAEAHRKAIIALMKKRLVIAGAIGAAIAAFLTVFGIATIKAKIFAKTVEDTIRRVGLEGEELAKKQDAEKKKIERLKEINNIQAENSRKNEVNNKLISEAETIVSSLVRTYGDLGIEIDKATGKVKGLNEAEKTMARRHLQQTIDQKKAEKQAQSKLAISKGQEAVNIHAANNLKWNHKTRTTDFDENGNPIFYGFWGEANDGGLIASGAKAKYDLAMAEKKKAEDAAASLSTEIIEMEKQLKEMVDQSNDPIKRAIFNLETLETSLKKSSADLFGKDVEVKDLSAALNQFKTDTFGKIKNLLDLNEVYDKNRDAFEKAFKDEDINGLVNALAEAVNNAEGEAKEKLEKILEEARKAVSDFDKGERIVSASDYVSGIAEKSKNNKERIEDVFAMPEIRDELEKQEWESIKRMREGGSSGKTKEFKKAQETYYSELYNASSTLYKELKKIMDSERKDLLKKMRSDVEAESTAATERYNFLTESIKDTIDKAKEASNYFMSLQSEVYSYFGTFNGMEAIDALYGGNGMAEQEKRKEELLKKLQEDVHTMAKRTKEDSVGEYV